MKAPPPTHMSPPPGHINDAEHLHQTSLNLDACLAEVDAFGIGDQVSKDSLNYFALNYLEGADGLPRVAETSPPQEEFFGKYSINGLPVDTRTCTSCLKCPCNFNNVSAQEALEADYLKGNIKFTDGKFHCKYLYRSDLADLPLIDNSGSAFKAALRTSSAISKLPLADRDAFNKNLEGARAMDALEPWDRVLKRHPELSKMPQRFVPGNHAHSGKGEQATTKVRPVFNSSITQGHFDPSFNFLSLKGPKSPDLQKSFTHLRQYPYATMTDIRKAFYNLKIDLKTVAL